MSDVTIQFQNESIDIKIVTDTEDELDWIVFDVDTAHTRTLNKLLHEHYELAVCNLVIAALKEKKAKAKAEAQYSDIQFKRSNAA